MISYTIDRRPDTGVTNVTMGVWLFLASEVMLFGALFSTYALLRISATVWPSGRATLNVAVGSVNTIVLLAMTGIIWRARRLDARTIRGTLAAATGLAIVFLALKAFEYHGEIARGFPPATNTFFAIYYTLTGLHALHVVFGVIANTWVMAGARRVSGELTTGRVRALTVYWTFVDVVWLILFGLLYLS